MSVASLRVASDVNKEGWEKSSFPVLCETCLGDNPYVRMQKEDYGVECKICVRPFTLFRWKAGTRGRYKATVVCQSCARMKNVCQTCLFDLEYGLPVQVRDRYLEEMGQSAIALPASRTGRDFVLQEAAKQSESDLPYNKVGKHPVLQKIARMTPYYKRNEARICSFYVKGACNRGQDCPFRHELPEGGELANQKLRDRFHGENDPVAKKIFRRIEEDPRLQNAKEKEPYPIIDSKGKRVKPPEQGQQSAASSSSAAAPGMPGMPGSSSGSTYRPYYPSMDPMAQGNAALQGEMPDERHVPRKA